MDLYSPPVFISRGCGGEDAEMSRNIVVFRTRSVYVHQSPECIITECELGKCIEAFRVHKPASVPSYAMVNVCVTVSSDKFMFVFMHRTLL